MRTVASYSKPEEAYLAASFLEGNGLRVSLRDAHTVSVNQFYSQAIGGVKVEVAEEDFELALELLSLPKEKDTGILCPYCGSSEIKLRDLSPLAALGLLGFGFLLPVASRRADCRDCRRGFQVRYDKSGEARGVE